jgi:protein-disulfide isomerase
MTHEDRVSRRAIVAGVAGGGLAVLAGCTSLGGGSGDGDGAGDGGETGPETPTRTPTSDPTPTPTRDGSGSGTETTTTGDVSLPTPTLGSTDASITVAAYEDFLCSHCAHYNLNGLPKIRSNYVDEGTVRYEHHDFPVVHEVSWYSAIAARSVQATVGQDAYWTYAEELFANRKDTSMELYRSLASDVGADPDVVERHVTAAKWKPVVEADMQRGKGKGVEATPTFLVDGDAVDPQGHSSWYDAVSAAINAALD